LGMLHLFRGEIDRAGTLIEQALTIARQLVSPFLEARCLNSLVDLELARGDLASAEARAYACLRLGQGTDDVFSHAMALTSLGDVQRSMGNLAQAAESYAQARDLFDRLGPGRPYHGLIHNMGYVKLGDGDALRAAALFLTSAEAYQRVGTDARGVAECLVGLAAVAVHVDEPVLGGQLMGAAEATLEAIGSSLSPSNRADYERTRAALEAALETQEFTTALTRGRQLSLDDALAAARRLADTSDSVSDF
jgi:tetratricopeptide (TPR) repeat protein